MTAAAKLVRSPAKASWHQMRIVKALFEAEQRRVPGGLSRGLRRMWGNSQVRFSGEGTSATTFPYATGTRGPSIGCVTPIWMARSAISILA